MIEKDSPVGLMTIFKHIKSMIFHHECSYGLWVLVIVNMILSVFAGIPEKQLPIIFVEGDIANIDVIADKDIVIEDIEANNLRYKQIENLQPLIFDLDLKTVNIVKEDILNLIAAIKKSQDNQDDELLNRVIIGFNSYYNRKLNENLFLELTKPETYDYVMNSLLPWVDNVLLAGVLPDIRVVNNEQQSIVVRNLDNNSEITRSVGSGILDLKTLLFVLKNKIDSETSLDDMGKKAVKRILLTLILPSLSLNQEAGKQRVQEILLNVDPILYHISFGEVIVREGDKVSRIDQLKMQALFDNTPLGFNGFKSLGVFLIGILITLGLFMTPSGVKGRVLKNKDQVFIGIIVLLVGSASIIMNSYSANYAMAFAFPVAGIAGLATLIFSARRYCGVGLLLSFFCSVLLNVGLEHFLFYFFSAMFSTSLILRTQSRQDVLKSIFPLMFFQVLIGIASVLLFDRNCEQLQYITLFIVINSIFSILILFALSPVLELLFGYTTRFRLMELMSLDHPLLQELMVSVPGTYHHSLVVSNLVESGAKAIGANSLLAKVGALYHDIGKLARPNYFSENQFDGINPHDKLAPNMSCLILFSHVKYGAELAQEYKLGEEISDMLLQHHGTRIPFAFFNKAKNMGENPNEADYRYPGPRPQTKEAAILMMADTAEAAIRSMGDPSPARIQSSVESLIKNIYADGQFDETDMTFKDLTKLIESFTRSLTGLYHQRVAYVDIKKTPEIKDNVAKNQKSENGNVT